LTENTDPLQPYRILPIAARVVSNGAGVGQRVFHHDRESADEGVPANPAELVYAGIRTQRDVVLDKHVTGQRSSICEYHVIPDAAVMGNVGLCHEQAVRSYLSQV